MRLFVDPISIIVVIVICVSAGLYIQKDKEVISDKEISKQGKGK